MKKFVFAVFAAVAALLFLLPACGSENIPTPRFSGHFEQERYDFVIGRLHYVYELTYSGTFDNVSNITLDIVVTDKASGEVLDEIDRVLFEDDFEEKDGVYTYTEDVEVSSM